MFRYLYIPMPEFLFLSWRTTRASKKSLRFFSFKRDQIMASIPGMAHGGMRVSSWLMSVAAGTAMVKIGKSGAFVRICRYSSRSSDSVSGQRARYI
jgi:hypothetical protein